MVNTTFEAQVRTRSSPAGIQLTLIDLIGEINGFAEAALNRAYQAAAREESRLIVLNFRRVEYINSTGIALIVGLLARAQRSRKTLAVCELSEHYQEIFQITRLADYMAVYPNEDSAVQAAESAR